MSYDAAEANCHGKFMYNGIIPVASWREDSPDAILLTSESERGLFFMKTERSNSQVSAQYWLLDVGNDKNPLE